ncbi:group II intron reverse transcriptase/maturase, partial [Xenorhabdus nematophila]|nr:group II intron reverse transcriptase/maturase [Xenorhabdus nematophila]
MSKKSADNKQQVFNNLGHLLNSDMLKGQFLRLDGNKAVGIDRMTKAAYGEHLDGNIHNLILRIRRGTYRPKA